MGISMKAEGKNVACNKEPQVSAIPPKSHICRTNRQR